MRIGKDKWQDYHTIPASEGWFVISIWGDGKELYKEPVVAWSCETYGTFYGDDEREIELTQAHPITCDQLSHQDNYAVQRPDGVIVFPCSMVCDTEQDALIELLRQRENKSG